MMNMELPDYVLHDLMLTGFEMVNLKPHRNLFILEIKEVRSMNWSAKDFSRFSWVISNHNTNIEKQQFKLKIAI